MTFTDWIKTARAMKTKFSAACCRGKHQAYYILDSQRINCLEGVIKTDDETFDFHGYVKKDDSCVFMVFFICFININAEIAGL